MKAKHFQFLVFPEGRPQTQRLRASLFVLNLSRYLLSEAINDPITKYGGTTLKYIIFKAIKL